MKKYDIISGKVDNKIIELVASKYSISQIAKQLQISVSSVTRRLKKLNIAVPNYHNALKFNNTVFDIINTEEKAYWLGFLYADGNVGLSTNSVTLSLSAKDREHLLKFNTFIENKKNIKDIVIKTNGKEYKACRIDICDKHFKQKLVNLGCVPRKSLKLQFPNKSIFTDPELIYAFIRGYVDGDGCISFSRNKRMSL